MSYAARADMESRFKLEELIQLTDRARTGVLNESVLNQALSDAQAVIDGYLRTAGVLPLANVPPELVRVCCDLARFFLHGDRVTPVVQQRRDEAMSWLRDVAAGRASLVLDAAGNVAQPVAGGVQYVSAGRVFSGSNLDGY